MLLNNFMATLYPNLKATDTSGSTTVTEFRDSYIASVAGNQYSDEPSLYPYFYPFKRGIAFGSGTTPPQKTDYKIENHITTGLTYSGNNNNQTNGVVNWVQTVQNTSTAQITITEVGLFAGFLLITRTVLDTPVVLQPNEVKTFTITIDYNKFVDGTIIQNS